MNIEGIAHSVFEVDSSRENLSQLQETQEMEDDNKEEISNNENANEKPAELTESFSSERQNLSQTISVDVSLNEKNEIQIERKREKVENEETANKGDGETEPLEPIKIEENTKNEKLFNSNFSKTKPEAKTSRRSANGSSAILDKKQFFAMLGRNDIVRRPKSMQTKRPKESYLTESSTKAYADDFMNGKNPNIIDPIALCDVIDVLIARKVEAMDQKNYLECDKIENAIIKARTKFRAADRNSRYEIIIKHAEEKIKDAENRLKLAKNEWKEKRNKLEQKQNDEREKLYQDHLQQHQNLDNYWKDPANYQFFSKRSAGQLQSLTIERNLVITGRFVEAEQVKKINERMEKNSIKEQYNNLKLKFDNERAKLIAVQDDDNQQLLYRQNIELQVFNEKERRDLTVKKKIIENIQKNLDEDKQFFHFCAHQYKRDPTILLPPTVVGGGNEDIPTMPAGRIYPRGVDETLRIKSKVQATPLNIPILKIKKYKVQRIGAQKKVANVE